MTCTSCKHTNLEKYSVFILWTEPIGYVDMNWHAQSLQSHPTLCGSMDCSPPGSSVHGISQARILEWVAISFSRRYESIHSCILYLATYLGICLPTHLHIWDRSGKEMAHDCTTWQVQNPWVRVPGNSGRVYVLQFWGSISSSLGNFSLCSQGLRLVGEACLHHGGFLWVLQRSRTNRLVGWVGESGCVSHSVVSDSLWPHGL